MQHFEKCQRPKKALKVGNNAPRKLYIDSKHLTAAVLWGVFFVKKKSPKNPQEKRCKNLAFFLKTHMYETTFINKSLVQGLLKIQNQSAGGVA